MFFFFYKGLFVFAISKEKNELLGFSYGCSVGILFCYKLYISVALMNHVNYVLMGKEGKKGKCCYSQL